MRYAILAAAVMLSTVPLVADDADLRVPATVVSVLDGDTFHAVAKPWPGWSVTISVRVNGIDTPEKGWRGKCDREKRAGKQATEWAESVLPPGRTVILVNPDNGKYAGRVLADVEVDGGDYAASIIAAGLAVAYDGGTKPDWCQ